MSIRWIFIEILLLLNLNIWWFFEIRLQALISTNTACANTFPSNLRSWSILSCFVCDRFFGLDFQSIQQNCVSVVLHDLKKKLKKQNKSSLVFTIYHWKCQTQNLAHRKHEELSLSRKCETTDAATLIFWKIRAWERIIKWVNTLILYISCHINISANNEDSTKWTLNTCSNTSLEATLTIISGDSMNMKNDTRPV